MRHKIIKKLLVCSLFAISSLTIPVTLTSCGNKNQQTSYVDYVLKTKIHHENWKETNFIKDGRQYKLQTKDLCSQARKANINFSANS